VEETAFITLHARAEPPILADPFAENVHLLAVSLDDEGWLEELPAIRPVIVVMDGLYPFMTKPTWTREHCDTPSGPGMSANGGVDNRRAIGRCDIRR
jgi:O-methyltransferase involved in polyketide biosynthesis